MTTIKCEWEMPTISHRRERGGREREREKEGGGGRQGEGEGGGERGRGREYIKIRKLLL